MPTEKRRRLPAVIIAATLLLLGGAAGCGYQGDICNSLDTYKDLSRELGLDSDQAWETVGSVFRCNSQSAP